MFTWADLRRHIKIAPAVRVDEADKLVLGNARGDAS